ncbi:hypothetical protein ACWEK5_51190 [Rhodococcus koreensis]
MATAPSVPAAAATGEPSAADTAAFVTAFRAQFPEFSTGRKDSPIESLLENTCQEISVGKEQPIIIRNAGKRAEYQGATPTPDQAQAIYDLVASHC